MEANENGDYDGDTLLSPLEISKMFHDIEVEGERGIQMALFSGPPKPSFVIVPIPTTHTTSIAPLPTLPPPSRSYME